MDGRTEARGLAAESADIIAELYPSLREFAAVVAGSRAEADEVILDTLSWMIPIRSLSDLDEPAVEVRRLMVERRSGWVRGRREMRTPAPWQSVRARAAYYLDAIEGRDTETVARIIGRGPDRTRRLIAQTTRRTRRRSTTGTVTSGVVVQPPAPDAGPGDVDALIGELDDRLSASARPITIGARPSSDMRRTLRGHGLLVAGGVVVAMLVVIAAGALPEGAPTAPRSEDGDPVALAAADESRPRITLAPAPRNESVQIATSIGTLEFGTLSYSPLDWYSGIVTTLHGAVAAPGLRWSDDYRTWEDVATGHPLVVAAGDDVLTYGSTDQDGNGVGVRLSWNGSGWTPSAELELPGPVDQIVVGPRGAVGIDAAQRRYTGERWEYAPQLVFYRSSDGVRFTTATQPPTGVDSGEAPDRRAFRPVRARRFGAFAGGCAPGRWSTGSDSIHSTEDGFLAFIAAQPADWGVTPICEPEVWFSPDGDVWSQVGGSAPFGASAAISVVAHHAGRFAAIGTIDTDVTGGTESALWASADGATWERVDVELPRITAIGAGELGWVIVGFDRLGGDIGLWVSPDSFTWDGPYDLSAVFGPARKPQQIVAGPDEIVILAERGITIGRLDGSAGS